MSTYIPPSVLLPPLVGSHGNLNLFTGIVDSSGGGKGTAISTALDLMSVTGRPAPIVTVGSGEGIAHQYARRNSEGEVEIYTPAVLFQAPEIDSLASMVARAASTVIPTLTSAWSGEQLGFAYVAKDKAILLERNTYRLSLVTGVQPKRAKWLIDTASSGFPQRFVWAPGQDPSCPDIVTPCSPMSWHWPVEIMSSPAFVLDLHPDITKQVDQARVSQLREQLFIDPLDAHRNLNKLKLAGIIAIIEHRTDISLLDWARAEYIMQISDDTRTKMLATLVQSKRKEYAQEGSLRAELKIAETRELNNREQCAEWVLKRLKEKGDLTTRELKQQVRHLFRTVLDNALEDLVQQGLITKSQLRANSWQYSLST